MYKIISTIVLPLLLLGCKTNPVMTPFPIPPAELMVRPPELKLIDVRPTSSVLVSINKSPK